MSLKSSQGRSISNYDECAVHLLSAFFCATGKTAQDARIRKAIETVLVDLAGTQVRATASNVIQFPRKAPG
ncbi:hypothetical protein [Bosea sp. BK604]|uniref:hypothetical protein n=1 Tax=Bosea sp. BK604 TaxID=2512180 RepID=UPI001044B10E|nr:hypothetical protein [Bosea sp. BK604]TCR65647.1 hypothetical protein EV560_105410 [Bosea sp. BK604]